MHACAFERSGGSTDEHADRMEESQHLLQLLVLLFQRGSQVQEPLHILNIKKEQLQLERKMQHQAASLLVTRLGYVDWRPDWERQVTGSLYLFHRLRAEHRSSTHPQMCV